MAPLSYLLVHHLHLEGVWIIYGLGDILRSRHVCLSTSGPPIRLDRKQIRSVDQSGEGHQIHQMDFFFRFRQGRLSAAACTN